MSSAVSTVKAVKAKREAKARQDVTRAVFTRCSMRIRGPPGAGTETEKLTLCRQNFVERHLVWISYRAWIRGKLACIAGVLVRSTIMARIVVLIFLHSALLSAQTSSLESFQIGRVEGDTWFITEVEPLSPFETHARFIKVYPACGTFHVDETEHVFEGISVGQLANNAALCASEKQVASSIALATRPSHHESPEDRQIVAARCGSDLVIHHLPAEAALRFPDLQRKAPAIAALFMLAEDISIRHGNEVQQMVSDSDPSGQRTRVQKRQQLEATATEIRSGKYDLVLPEIPPSRRSNGQAKLSLGMPSPEEAAGLEVDFGKVENPEQLGLENSGEVAYPSLARIAHIEGEVKLELGIESQSGKVLSASATSGHIILQRAAIDAALSWIFPHPYLLPGPVPVVVHFKIRCPVLLDTRASSSLGTIRPQRHRRNSNKRTRAPSLKKGKAP